MSTERNKLAYKYAYEGNNTGGMEHWREADFKAGWNARDAEVQRLKNQFNIVIRAMHEMSATTTCYAHNQDIFEKALSQLRAFTEGDK